MSNEIKTRSLTPTEQKYTYAQSMQLEGQTVDNTVQGLANEITDRNNAINALRTEL